MKKILPIRNGVARFPATNWLLASALALMPVIATAAEKTERQVFDIASQPLSTALHQFSEQTKLIVLASGDVVRNRVSANVEGEYSPLEALTLMLASSGAVYEVKDEETLLIRAANQSPDGADKGKKNRDSRSDREVLEEVIVTATKRAVSLQDVPQAVSAFGEARLKKMGADTFQDFALSVPGLSMNQAGANNARFTIRGVTTSPFGSNVQETVVTYVDDLPTGDSRSAVSTADLRLFDVERVEVLRGPQGTLFGSGAMGGAIRVITNKPDLAEQSGSLDFGLSSTQGGDMSNSWNGMINIPLIPDKLAVRAVAYYRDEGGWIDNIGVNGIGAEENSDSETAYGGRLLVKYQATENLAIQANLTYQNSEPGDLPYFNSVVNGERARATSIHEFIYNKQSILNLVVDYDMDWATFKSSTTYYKSDGGSQIDYSFYSAFVLPEQVPTTLISAVPSDNYFQEFHLSSNDNEQLNWFVGAFYRFQDDRDFLQTIYMPGSEAVLGSSDAGAPGDYVMIYRALYDTKEKAIFGELSWNLTDQLEATVGMRYFTHSIDQVAEGYGAVLGGRRFQQYKSDDKSTNLKFSLSYEPTDDFMVYLSATEGYRVGSPNVPAPGVPDSYGPDSLWNYEIGAKTSFLDHRVTVNSALYYIDWKEMQVTTISSGGNYYIGNVGAATSKGIEIEISAAITDNLEYIGSVAWTDAAIDVDNVALKAKAGDRVPGVARYTYSNLLRQNFEISSGIDGYIQLNHSYVGESKSEYDPVIGLDMGDYHLVGLRSGVFFNNWEVSLFADNLLNSDDINLARQYIVNERYYRLRPRTIGINMRLDF